MDKSPKDQIETIVRSLEERGSPAAPFAEAIELGTTHPEAVGNLARAVMQRFPKGGTFLDAAFTYLPQEEWPELVRDALDYLTTSRKNPAAESVIEYAALQAPSALHEHLSRLFTLRPKAYGYYTVWPWRESGEIHFEFLKSVLEDDSATDDSKRRAWRAMLETRSSKILEFALGYSETVRDKDSRFTPVEWQNIHLHFAGYHWDSGDLRRICSDKLYHIQFPESYFEGESRPPWMARIHPTWRLAQSPGTLMPLGGNSTNNCALCKQQLHRLLVLDPIPSGLGVSGIARLEIATCLSCLGWEQQPLFYEHGTDGIPQNVGYEGPQVTPQFPVGPLRSTEFWLAETPRRWYWQDWGSSNSRENLNRIGGEPTWIQDADYPSCPSCQRVMTFLLQLDSDLVVDDAPEWLWGSGGIGYCFWCDDCKISGLHWQCT